MAVEDQTPNLTSLANLDKSEIKFYSYGIITLPAIPLLLLGAHIVLILGAPQIYFLVWIALAIRFAIRGNKEHDPETSNFVSRLLYVLIQWGFGFRTAKRNTHQFRLEWFLLFGGPVLGFLLIWVYASSIFIVPGLLIIFKRKWFLRTAFKIALLPRSEYFVGDLAGPLDEQEFEKLKQRRDEQEKELQYQAQVEYLHFYSPKRGGRTFAYFFLMLSPLIFLFAFTIFLQLVLEDSGEEKILETVGIIAVWGYIGIIPYFFLSLFRRKRITKFVTTSLAESVVSTVTSTSINYLPMFNGDYYFEQNSRVVDMSDNYGFFEIFRSGRWFTIFLIPLAAVSFIFTQILSRADDERTNIDESFTTENFLDAFSDEILIRQSGALIFFLVLLLPILISILLPLMWVLKDSELKRTTWEMDEGGGERREISGVEDLGTTLNRIFGLVLGLSTITGLSSITRRLVNRDTSSTDVYTIVFIMVIIGGLLVLPGTLFMAYRYFSLGDHAAGVNYLRYNLSQSEKIGVGTIVKGYDTILTLPEPNSPYIIEQIGLETAPK